MDAAETNTSRGKLITYEDIFYTVYFHLMASSFVSTIKSLALVNLSFVSCSSCYRAFFLAIIYAVSFFSFWTLSWAALRTFIFTSSYLFAASSFICISAIFLFFGYTYLATVAYFSIALHHWAIYSISLTFLNSTSYLNSGFWMWFLSFIKRSSGMLSFLYSFNEVIKSSKRINNFFWAYQSALMPKRIQTPSMIIYTAWGGFWKPLIVYKAFLSIDSTAFLAFSRSGSTSFSLYFASSVNAWISFFCLITYSASTETIA